MTAVTTTPLQSKFGPIVADAAGTITVQEASDVLDCSRFRVGELLNASSGRVLVTDVLALTSLVPPSALEAPPRCQARPLLGSPITSGAERQIPFRRGSHNGDAHCDGRGDRCSVWRRWRTPRGPAQPCADEVRFGCPSMNPGRANRGSG